MPRKRTKYTCPINVYSILCGFLVLALICGVVQLSHFPMITSLIELMNVNVLKMRVGLSCGRVRFL